MREAARHASQTNCYIPRISNVNGLLNWPFACECVGGRLSHNSHIQVSAERRTPGLVNFATALAYHFCLALPAAFTQPADQLLAEPSIQYLAVW